jgi:hypothetical protein
MNSGHVTEITTASGSVVLHSHSGRNVHEHLNLAFLD